MQRGVERTATTTCAPLMKMRAKALEKRLTMMKSCKRGACCACSLSATSRASSRDAGFFLDSAAGNHTQAPSVSGHTSQSSSSSHEGSHGAILRSCVRHGGAATANRGVFQCCCWSTTRLPRDLWSNGSVASATCWIWSACSENTSWAMIRVCTSAACPRAALRQMSCHVGISASSRSGARCHISADSQAGVSRRVACLAGVSNRAGRQETLGAGRGGCLRERARV